MRIACLVGDILLSPLFWGTRIATLGISSYIIWRIYMTDFTEYILMTPVEFIPVLLGVAFLFTTVFVYVKAIPDYNDMNKEKLRNGTITQKIKYGMDYLISDVTSFVTSIAAAVFVPGAFYVSVLRAEPDLAGCILMAIIISILVGYGGVKVLHIIVDTFRDNAKIKDLETKE